MSGTADYYTDRRARTSSTITLDKIVCIKLFERYNLHTECPITIAVSLQVAEKQAENDGSYNFKTIV